MGSLVLLFGGFFLSSFMMNTSILAVFLLCAIILLNANLLSIFVFKLAWITWFDAGLWAVNVLC